MIEQRGTASRGKVILALTDVREDIWRQALQSRREIVSNADSGEDPSIHYALAWKPKPGSLAKLPGLKAIFSLGAGVDHLMGDATLPDVPIVRIVDENLTSHMTDYVCWRVLDHHRKGRIYREQQAERIWRQRRQTVAKNVTVGIMGLGELGRAAATRLLALGYRVCGWSRTGSSHPGVESFRGEDGLHPFLASTDILVALLPHTPRTEGILDHALLSRLKQDGPLGGPVLINAGRGRLQKEADILRALDDGILYEASLDVFETEPLPADSPLWTHPRVFITPHAAAESDPQYLAPSMLDQMDAFDRGEPLKNLVDREAGY